MGMVGWSKILKILGLDEVRLDWGIVFFFFEKKIYVYTKVA
jgi:hypothetical protein